MKKLMCALAAVAASVAFAEDAAPAIESSNIVGYQNKAPEYGFKMVGSVFYTIGNEDESLNITDLTVVGYEDNEAYDFEDEFFEGSLGDFQILLLNAQGGADTTYSWNHSYFEGAWDPAGGAWDAEPGTKLARGQGLWFYANVWSEKVKLVSSGAALVRATNIPVNYGFTPITIPLARAVSLSEITPSDDYLTSEDYDFEDEFFEGSLGDFQILILNPQGGADETYSWNHSYFEGGWDVAGGSWDNPEPVTFEVGDGIWYYANVWSEETTLNFPGLEDNED